ncbi:GNAT family N-acetyltransferase [candidate division KSB1 bacterium]
MEFIHVTMIMDTLDNLPEYPVSSGYSFRNYKKGDEEAWAEIETSAGEFKNVSSALKRFQSEFGPYLSEMKNRCLFLYTDEGEKIGTATAWYNSEFKDGAYGRLHWVGIRPEYQGRGLGRPLIGAAMKRIAELHQKSYLTSQTTSAAGIKIYLDFGFIPYVSTDDCRRAWRLLAHELNHPALKEFV